MQEMLWSKIAAGVKMTIYFLSKSKNKQINESNISFHICSWNKIRSAEIFNIPETSAVMRTNFLLILGLCAGSLQQTVVCVAQGFCYEKDKVPVDVDVLYDDHCVDVEGNIYDLGSELHSCCDCFRL